MKAIDPFVISVGMSDKDCSVASNMARLQQAILEIYDSLGDEAWNNERLNKINTHFQNLKKSMYGATDAITSEDKT
jgi:hypothetical protein